MLELVRNGPVAIDMLVTPSFQFYGGGVYVEPEEDQFKKVGL